MVDDIAEVITNDLVVRSLPEISGRSAIDEVRLNRDQHILLYVLDGPMSADAYDWYLVVPFFDGTSDVYAAALPGVGWVAAGKDAEAWIAPWKGRCPEPTLDAVRYLPSFLRLACFGNRELTFDGELGECTYVVPGTVNPAWLSTQFCLLYPEGYVPDLIGPFMVHLEPADFAVREGPRLRVRATGAFDHPAARGCEHHPVQGDEPVPAERVVLGCRSAFVATSIQEL